MSLRPVSYFIQHMALTFSRVTPPSFHQSSFLPEACAARASGECGRAALAFACVEPVTSEGGLPPAQPASARQNRSVVGRIAVPRASDTRPTDSPCERPFCARKYECQIIHR